MFVHDRPLCIYRPDKSSAATHMATAKRRDAPFPVFSLPLELRHAVYRFVLSRPSGKVEVVSNFLEGRSVAKIRFYTAHELALLETNKQMRMEAGNLFYTESVFTLYSYHRTQEHGQKPFYGKKCFHIDFNRVVKCHVLTPSGFEPLCHDDCLKGAIEFGILLRALVDTLAKDHNLRYLLIQSYMFERVATFEDFSEAYGLRNILKPLEEVHGLDICHIHAMKMSHWPYLRSLERELTKYRSERSDEISSGSSVWERALTCNQALKTNGAQLAFDNPDLPKPNILFDLFGTQPLYQDVEFLNNYEDDILI